MPAVLILISPLPLLLAALVAFAGPGLRPRAALRCAEAAALAAFLAAALAALLVTLGAGAGTTGLTDLLAVRPDALNLTMLLLVSGIGWVVLRFSASNLDGASRQGAFTGWVCVTLAAVLVLVSAGSLPQLVLGWVATGFGLHRLLLFCPERPGAQRAARRKAMVDRAGDAALVAAALLLALASGTVDIGAILAMARAGEAGGVLPWAAGLLALAAMLKSAQFPAHAWLIETMETPTPVSALLHAGVINAGGFLLIRFADVMLLAPGVLAALAIVGGLTALTGGLVMLTQSAVKNSLAWSTVAQMGFMILQCGLALFPLALLHIVLHSLYKAHAFLSAGSAVALIAAQRRPGPVAVPGGRAVARAFLLAVALYAVVATGFGFAGKSPQALALGAILIFGVAYLLAQGLADAAPRLLTRRTAFWSVLATLAYFALHEAARALTSGLLPQAPVPGPLEWAVIILALASFGAVAVAQAMFPLWAHHPAAAGLRVHLANGLYAGALFDRALGGWSARVRS